MEQNTKTPTKISLYKNPVKVPVKKRDFAPNPPKRNISQTVAFVVFVAFLGTTMLIFEKFKNWAFRKVMQDGNYFH